MCPRMLRSRCVGGSAIRIRTRIGVILTCGIAMYVSACSSIPRRPELRTEFWGFTAPWDPRSTRSVAQHRAQLDVVISGWIALDSTTFRPVVFFPDTIVTHDGKSRRDMTLVTSYQGGHFHPEVVRGLAMDSTALGHAAGEIASMVGGAGYSGIVLDLEGMTPSDLPMLLAFTKAVADSARGHGVGHIGLAIPATDTAAYPARILLSSLDFLVVMLYDQHWLTSPPGPIAAPDWVRRVLGVRIGEVGASKLVAAFPAYGYEWRSDSATAVLSYDDARQHAADAQASLERDPVSMTLHTQATGWTIWVSDAVLLDSLVQDARISGVTKFALWRLGLEDPAVWTRVIQ
jgi:spore germination protein YaaH